MPGAVCVDERLFVGIDMFDHQGDGSHFGERRKGAACGLRMGEDTVSFAECHHVATFQRVEEG